MIELKQVDKSFGDKQVLKLRINERYSTKVAEGQPYRARLTSFKGLIRTYFRGNVEYLRSVIQPKYKGPSFCQIYQKEEKTWFQVFSSGRDFIPHLSVIDLLCSEGPDAISYL